MTTAKDIDRIIDHADRILKRQAKDFDYWNDMPGIIPVFRIGDWGWVSEEQWDAVFDGLPDWAPVAYEVDANDPDWEGLRDRIAAAVDQGGRQALWDWCQELQDDNEFDVVFWTQVGQDT